MGLEKKGSAKEGLLHRTVGTQPLVEASIGGVQVLCLVDTGSQVSMVDESFFKQHLEPKLGAARDVGGCT